MMGSVFAMQGFGQLAGSLVMLACVAGFKDSLQSAVSYAKCTGICADAVDKSWRVMIGKPVERLYLLTNLTLLGFGAVPAVIALYFRLTIPETPRYTFDIARDVEKAGEDVDAYMNGKAEGKPDELSRAQALVQANQLEVQKASFRDFISFYGKWKNGKILLGTTGSWFLFDVAFYGLGLNSSTVLTAIGFAGGSNVYHILYNLASGNAILTCAGAIPGYWISVATVDTIGRKPIQIGGFCILTVLFIVWGFDFGHLSGHAQFVLYVFIQLFFNFGKLSIHHMVKFILICFRPQRNHLHRAWRVFPNPIPLHLPRYLCRFRQDWLHHCPSRHCSSPNPRRHRLWPTQDRGQPMAQPCYANLLCIHVRRYLHQFPHPRDQEKDPRGSCW